MPPVRDRLLRFIRAMVIGGDASDLAELRRIEPERVPARQNDRVLLRRLRGKGRR